MSGLKGGGGSNGLNSRNNFQTFMDPIGIGTKKNPEQPGNPAAEELSRISRQLFDESTPLRRGMLDRSQQFLDGNLDVTASPMYEGLKAGSDLNFNRARTNTIANTPSGGGLIDALTNLETNRAVNMAQGSGQIAEGELGRALSLATGSNATSAGGLGSAAGIQQQQLAAQQAMQGQQKQAAGSAGGAMLAAMLA